MGPYYLSGTGYRRRPTHVRTTRMIWKSWTPSTQLAQYFALFQNLLRTLNLTYTYILLLNLFSAIDKSMSIWISNICDAQQCMCVCTSWKRTLNGAWPFAHCISVHLPRILLPQNTRALKGSSPQHQTSTSSVGYEARYTAPTGKRSSHRTVRYL